jgi:hypothetical protein
MTHYSTSLHLFRNHERRPVGAYEHPVRFRVIPDALWAAAGELAREHGVNQVSRALHLEFKHLKRVTEAGPQNGGKQAKPSFIELIAPPTSAARECILELEGPRGKLRIELKDTATTEVAAIGRALWEMLA